jgi:hypothetical protein
LGKFRIWGRESEGLPSKINSATHAQGFVTHLLEIWQQSVPTPRRSSTKEAGPPVIILFRTSVNYQAIDSRTATEKVASDDVCCSISQVYLGHRGK